MRTVLMKSGEVGRFMIYAVEGACFIGEPTAYFIYLGQRRYVVPGESVEFVEV